LTIYYIYSHWNGREKKKRKT